MTTAQQNTVGVRAEGMPVDSVTAAQVVEHLRSLLARDDPAAPEFFQQNGIALKAALGGAFHSVETHTLTFDFEKALDAMATVSDL
ncbi:hypothetical protein D3C71_1823650 [compost metagenome]